MSPIQVHRGPPPSLEWSSFASPELRARVRPSTAVDEALRSCAQPLVVIAGASGTGKSSLAASLVRASGLVPSVFVAVRHLLAEPSQIDACVAAKALVIEFDDEPRAPEVAPRGQTQASADLDRQLRLEQWEEMVDEAVEQGTLERFDVAALVWPRVTGGRFTILTTCRDARSFLDDHPVLEEARHELTVIELDSSAAPHDLTMPDSDSF